MKFTIGIKCHLTTLKGVCFILMGLPGYASALENGQSGQTRTAQSSEVPRCGSITPAGCKVLAVLDHSNVERRWLNHRHVN